MSKALTRDEHVAAVETIIDTYEALRSELDEAKQLLRDVQSSAVQAGHERWKRIDAFLARTAEG